MRELEFLSIVEGELDPCPYLPGEQSRLPLAIPVQVVTPERVDLLLEQGYRRTGGLFYRTDCPSCSACEPLRVDVEQFKPSRSQRRAWNKATGALRVAVDRPTLDAQRVELFNLHRDVRGLNQRDSEVDAAGYESFLLNAPYESFEVGLFHDDQLIAIAISDVGASSLSAVYTFFDPAYSRFSPGTVAILVQWELARAHRLQWLYLGYYVAANRHLNYKARFRPHERRIDGHWQPFDSI